MGRVLMLCAALVLATQAAFAQERKAGEVAPEDKVIFDFETPADVAAWSPVDLTEVKDKSPAPRIEWTTEHATSGKGALKLTFDGGRWPAVATVTIPVPDGWEKFQTIRLDIRASRDCVVGMRIDQEKGSPKKADAKAEDPPPPPNRWWKLFALLAGLNEVEFPLRDRWYGVFPQFGRVVSFTFTIYHPQAGESIVIDNVRLSADRIRPNDTGSLWSPYCQAGFSMAAKREWARTRAMPKFQVPGTDLIVKDVADLGAKLKDRWVAPTAKTVDQVEAEFRALYDDLKKTHPNAVLATFRDGEKGFDPANPGRVYDGWRDTYLNCHGPDAPGDAREVPQGKAASRENFMRHRGLLMKADLSTIPRGSNILAAKFLLVATTWRTPQTPNMFACEPCCRDWDETVANCYEYAPGKLWKQISGCYYGEDPDFLPVYAAFGQATPPTDAWDFTNAVRFWTSGEPFDAAQGREPVERHPNFGFFLHGDAGEYQLVQLRETRDVRQRPAIMVIYEPK